MSVLQPRQILGLKQQNNEDAGNDEPNAENSRSPIINSGIFTSETFPGVAKITPGALTKKMESHGKPYG